jgi:hypothetical protein
VQLVAPGNTGVHVIAPLFVMVPTMGSEVHDLSNSTVDISAPAGGSKTIVAIDYFYNWKAGSKVRIEFSKIENATVNGDGGGIVVGCKDVMDYQNSAAPQFNACLGCHGGNNAMAQNALDMKALTNPINYGTACSQALFKVNLQNRAQSSIIVTPRDQLNNHPYKVPAMNAQTFTNALLTWINKE